MPSAYDWEPANGITFLWNGTEYEIMKTDYEESVPSRPREDMTPLSVAPGSEAVMALSPIIPKRDPKKFTIAYRHIVGTAPIEANVEATLETEDGTGTFRCLKVGKARESGKWIEGTAEFEEVIDDEVVDFGS